MAGFRETRYNKESIEARSDGWKSRWQRKFLGRYGVDTLKIYLFVEEIRLSHHVRYS